MVSHQLCDWLRRLLRLLKTDFDPIVVVFLSVQNVHCLLKYFGEGYCGASEMRKDFYRPWDQDERDCFVAVDCSTLRVSYFKTTHCFCRRPHLPLTTENKLDDWLGENLNKVKGDLDHHAVRLKTRRLDTHLLLPHLFWHRNAHVSAPSQHPIRARLVLLPASGLEWAGPKRRLPAAADGRTERLERRRWALLLIASN